MKQKLIGLQTEKPKLQLKTLTPLSQSLIKPEERKAIKNIEYSNITNT